MSFVVKRDRQWRANTAPYAILLRCGPDRRLLLSNVSPDMLANRIASGCCVLCESEMRRASRLLSTWSCCRDYRGPSPHQVMWGIKSDSKPRPGDGGRPVSWCTAFELQLGVRIFSACSQCDFSRTAISCVPSSRDLKNTRLMVFSQSVFSNEALWG